MSRLKITGLTYPHRALGLMSGTSLDGIDCAMVLVSKSETESDQFVYTLENFKSYPYSDCLRKRILKESANGSGSIRGLCSLNREIGLEYVKAVSNFLADFSYKTTDFEYISSHGQTVWHNPNQLDGYYSSTLQIGDATAMAFAFNKTVVYDFRPMDISAGGVGAPLVPMSEFLIYRGEPVILVNIGGISNITYLPYQPSINDLIAFDTGPGNMLIDIATTDLFDRPYDIDGKIAETGIVNEELLNYLKTDSYLTAAYPKATGREVYGYNRYHEILSYSKRIGVNNQSIVSTLTAFTAQLIIDQIRLFFPEFHGNIVVSGGGANNPELMKEMRRYANDNLEVKTLYEYNRGDVDAKEAMAFAILGHLRLIDRPGNVLGATKATVEVALGSIILPPKED